MTQQLSLRILNRISPKLLWTLYDLRAKKQLTHSNFILSFDCDTEDDIAVVWDVHSKLQEMGVTPVYAVPGELLKKGQEVYRKIHKTGAEFINHGGREHTYFDELSQSHASCFFYDKQSYECLKEDILMGDRLLKEILGIQPKGWRTPHFGTFQKPEHFTFLYGLLRQLDYTFSTSTSPAMAYKKGPIYKQDGIIEIPVTGNYSEPFNIMDTWAYFAAPNRTKLPKEYVIEAQSISSYAKKNPMLINIYGDPSHIYDKPEFFEAMSFLATSAKNTNYTQLLESAMKNHAVSDKKLCAV